MPRDSGHWTTDTIFISDFSTYRVETVLASREQVKKNISAKVLYETFQAARKSSESLIIKKNTGYCIQDCSTVLFWVQFFKF